MATDYLHSLSRMRPDYDREIVNRLAYANKTDVDQNLRCRLDLTVEFVPSQRRTRETADISFNVSLEFHASTDANRRPPYDLNVEDTDVEDNDD